MFFGGYGRARRRLAAACLVVAGVTGAATAAAQETRAGQIAEKQKAKAANLEPYRPTRFEAVMNSLEQSFASPPSGLYPTFGSVYSGGGLALGAGYRYFYGRNSVFAISGLYSIKNYKNVEIGTRTPWNLAGRWTFDVRAGWMDATQIGFYGLGMATQSADRGNFRLKQTYGSAAATFEPTTWTFLKAEGAYDDQPFPSLAESGAGSRAVLRRGSDEDTEQLR